VSSAEQGSSRELRCHLLTVRPVLWPGIRPKPAPGRGARLSWLQLGVAGQIPPRLGLAITSPLDEEPDGRLGITLIDGLDGNVGNAHGTTLTYAQRRTLVPRRVHVELRIPQSGALDGKLEA
jgi:hypothetical protein